MKSEEATCSTLRADGSILTPMALRNQETWVKPLRIRVGPAASSISHTVLLCWPGSWQGVFQFHETRTPTGRRPLSATLFFLAHNDVNRALPRPDSPATLVECQYHSAESEQEVGLGPSAQLEQQGENPSAACFERTSATKIFCPICSRSAARVRGSWRAATNMCRRAIGR
jgi:hypothetical protein